MRKQKQLLPRDDPLLYQIQIGRSSGASMNPSVGKGHPLAEKIRVLLPRNRKGTNSQIMCNTQGRQMRHGQNRASHPGRRGTPSSLRPQKSRCLMACALLAQPRHHPSAQVAPWAELWGESIGLQAERPSCLKVEAEFGWAQSGFYHDSNMAGQAR